MSVSVNNNLARQCKFG